MYSVYRLVGNQFRAHLLLSKIVPVIIIKSLLLYIALVYQTERQLHLFSEPSHCVAVLFFFKLTQLVIMFNYLVLYSYFCVGSVSLSNFSFMFLMAFRNWEGHFHFSYVFFHAASMVNFFMNVQPQQTSKISTKLCIYCSQYLSNSYPTPPLSYSNYQQ